MWLLVVFQGFTESFAPTLLTPIFYVSVMLRMTEFFPLPSSNL
jgi:hypothetical protein